MLKKILLFLLLPLLLGNCIKEKTEDCNNGLRLQFRYIHNNQNRDLLAEQVSDIRVYIFDQNTGLLADIISVSTEEIATGYADVVIPDGIYTAIAWGYGQEMAQGGYTDFAITDPASLTETLPVEIGHTTADQFRMMLCCEAFTGSGYGDVIPSVREFDDLFYASKQDISVKTSNQQTVTLDFIKNTCTLKVTITGLEHIGDYNPDTRAAETTQTLGVYATGCNGLYRYNNHVDTYAPLIQYESYYKSMTPTKMEVDIKVHRLELARHNVEPVTLYIDYIATDQNMIYPLDVLETILSAKDSDNNYLYANQEDIDREDEFPIEISILHDLTMRVIVKGFEVVEVIPEIEKPSK